MTANRWSKKVPELPRLSIREAVTKWGERGTIPRIREGDIT